MNDMTTYKKSSTKKFLQLSTKPLLKVAVVLCCAIFNACSTAEIEFEKKDLTITNLDGKTIPINVELARSRREMEKGFMGRTNIPEGTGMLFMFKTDQRPAFWMKDTPTPLSIAFISSSGEICETYDMTPFSKAKVESSQRVRYALEVPQGWFKKNNIGPGCTLNSL